MTRVQYSVEARAMAMLADDPFAATPSGRVKLLSWPGVISRLQAHVTLDDGSDAVV